MFCANLNLLRTISLSSFIVIYLTACATLNKDECRTANWNLIGVEDGSKGYPLSRIGAHRKACAEYGISPNLEHYKQGRTEGLRKYCVPANGFNLGKNGIAYKGICSDINEVSFLSAYKHGQQIRAAEQDLKAKHELRDQKQQQLDNNIAKIKEIEQRILGGKITGGQAVLLVVETQQLASQQGGLLNEIQHLDAASKAQAEHISQLKQQYQY